MDPVTLLFRLPLLPLQGLVKIGQIIQEQAEDELYNPASVQRELEEAAEARAQGRMSDEEVSQVERAAVARLTGEEG
ncbi:MAG: gas vesicle protein G [Nocardiopsaceae bacterium]|nr:gas vesicle protein G [Nocardiopsaceae bacterium]